MSTTVEKKPFLRVSLTTQILIACIAAIIFGTIVGPWASNLKVIGDIWLRLIMMNVVLMVMTAVSAAIGNADPKSTGKIGFHTFKWIIIITVASALLGVALAMIIQPAAGLHLAGADTAKNVPFTSFSEIIIGSFSSNIVSSMASGAMVPCIVFSLFFGAAMGTYKRHSGKTIINDFITSFNAVILNIIKFVMQLAPIGVFCLLADVSGRIGFGVITPMLKHLGLMAIATVFMIVVYSAIAAMLAKVNPLKMPKKFAKMSLVAFTTCSSAVTLPTEMEDAVTKFGISRRVVDFTGPICMSMNSNGVMVSSVASIFFMAQACDITLSLYQIVLGIGLTMMMCMGTIVVPGGAAITLPFLAMALGLPVDAVPILLAIDWFSDMFRTVANVDSDVLVGLLVADKVGELDRDVYNGTKTVEYVQG